MKAFLDARIKKTLGEFELDMKLKIPRGWGALFGRSGVGKTTDLRCIAGILRPDEGEIRISGRKVFSPVDGIDEPVRRRGIGMVPPGGALFPHLSVLENILFGSKRPDQGKAPSVQSVVEILEIGDLLKRLPREISSGERQRVAIGRAILSGPRLLLMDEPLANLDEPLRRKIVRYISRIKEELDLSCLYVTHALGEVLTLCDHVSVLDKGKVIGEGPPLEVLARPKSVALADLTGLENILSLEVLGHVPDGGLTRLRMGKEVLEVPLSDAPVGSSLRVGFRAEDVIVAPEPPGPTSARNCLQGRILTMEEDGGEVRVTVYCGEKVLALITPASRRSLDLKEGKEVTLLLKVRSCHLLDE